MKYGSTYFDKQDTMKHRDYMRFYCYKTDKCSRIVSRSHCFKSAGCLRRATVYEVEQA